MSTINLGNVRAPQIKDDAPTSTNPYSGEKVEERIATRLKEPDTGLAVNRWLRVAAIDEGGHAILEYVDAQPISTTDHNTLTNRDAANAHPISAISGLTSQLDNTIEKYQGVENAGKVMKVDSTGNLTPQNAYSLTSNPQGGNTLII